MAEAVKTTDVSELEALLERLKQTPDSPETQSVVEQASARLRALMSNASVEAKGVTSSSEAEPEALYNRLLPRLAMTENFDGAPNISIIKAALMKDTQMMSTMLGLSHGDKTKLVVTKYQPAQQNEKGFLFFAEAQEHNIEDVENEVATLNELTDSQKNAAIERVIQSDSERFPDQYTDDNKAKMRIKLHSHCDRELSPKDGLDYWQSSIFVAHSGGRLPSHLENRTIAEKNPKLNDRAWTWRLNEEHSLLQIEKSGGAPDGSRRRGKAVRSEFVADNRYGLRGGLVAGLRVQL